MSTPAPTSPNHRALAKLIRPAERLTFSEIARRVGCSAQAVRLWFNGAVPGDEFKPKLAEVLGLPENAWVARRSRTRKAA